MKSFFETQSAGGPVYPSMPPAVDAEPARSDISPPERIRIAIYDAPGAAPRVQDMSFPTVAETIEELSSAVYTISREQGGRVPYTVVREVVENLIHADFSEVVVSIMDDGNTIRLSDQGPGIPDKERVFLPGFSTADGSMKHLIKGVGSGLPIVREALQFSGGEVLIEDNLGRGAVVTVRVVAGVPEPVAAAPEASDQAEAEEASTAETAPKLSVRSKQVLSLAMELGTIGPSLVAKELKVGLSTAYRDLAHLESLGLVVADEAGKRALSEKGIALLDDLLR